MGHRIARWLFEPLLRLLLPGTGRRRKPVRQPVLAPCQCPHLRSRTARPGWERPLRGEDSPLVRPYVARHGTEMPV
ncbi:hypothetical protein [Streptomyces sp. TRM68367]|uniref:hypothetical protein n=1 Tax=Streptomyces sp. TRM68367 TaxID=2758415 RepID=UPI00165C7063|nr:hypothetical protein [Streptomyces sp. TRM68367]MBC9726737.1 hypothetical protein [Streptomyces sp. TRM68367]